MRNKGLTILLLASATLCANAGAQEYSRSSARGQQVKAYGTEPETEVARGFGNEVPLGKALKVIVPRDYVVRTAGVDRWWLEQPVSWQGGRDWTEALRDVLAPYPELVADVSRSSKMVLLRVRNSDAAGDEPRETADYVPPPRDARASRDARPASPASASAAAPARAGGYGYRGPSRAAETWDIHASDKTLQTAISRWAQNAGWQLSWELPVDYPVDARASIGGSFEGAVEAVVRSMERADVPMKAIFYNGNRVLRIVAKGAE